MTILSIDPGTANIGLAAIRLDGDRIEVLTLKHLQRAANQSVGEIFGVMIATLDAWRVDYPPVDLIACESTHFRAGFGRAGLQLSECVGVVRTRAAAIGLEFTTIEPAAWKKALTGTGTATYGTIKSMLKAQVGYPGGHVGDLHYRTEHELAALGIGIAAGRVRQTAEKVGRGR